jgi:hypothetical protein
MGGTEPVGGAAAKRVLGGVLLSGVAFVVFALFGGGTAYGLSVTSQDADVNNTGVGIANSGGNAAVGNVSDDQTAVNVQGAAAGGGIAANEGRASNESSGSATIVTGAATGVGNQSSTGVGQSDASLGGGGGLDVTAQDADVNNAGVGVGNSGLNAAVGNVNGDQTAVNVQGAAALGGAAFNAGSASNVSRGSATVITGPATGIGNQSTTNVNQSAVGLGGLFGPGLGIVVQDADVNNFGVGLGNSGLNLAVGNISGDQTAVNVQGAFALFGVAANFGGASNVSSGDALIVTGPATGIGNQSATGVSQSALGTGGWWFAPSFVLQDVDVDNVGVGLANSGLNFGLGNISGAQNAVNVQGAFALFGLAVNTGGASNLANGSQTTVTGAAAAIGNQASTFTSQFAMATGAPVGPGLAVFWPAFVFLGLLFRRR